MIWRIASKLYCPKCGLLTATPGLHDHDPYYCSSCGYLSLEREKEAPIPLWEWVLGIAGLLGFGWFAVYVMHHIQGAGP